MVASDFLEITAITPMLQSEVAVVVGASRGIGAEIAVHLVSAGVAGIGLLARSSAGLQTVAQRCRALRLGVQVVCLRQFN